jgi:tRNA threonylcarbamoyl adenosine modification protein (Sua5/YciO/YrdC/YwlC family)
LLVEIDPVEPESWLIGRVADQIRRGGVAVVPTDTVYGLACSINDSKAIQRIYDLKRMDPKKPLSILVGDMQSIGQYARGVSTPAYRIMKRVLPGPYTFIFQATSEVPKIMLRKRKTIGIRMPDDPIAAELLAELNEPLLSTSIRNTDDDFMLDPTEIDTRYGSRVDVVVDGGRRLPAPSTVVDLSGDQPVLLREGKGDVSVLQLFE